MDKHKCFSYPLGTLVRNLLFLTLGLLIGIRFTILWYTLQYNDDDTFAYNDDVPATPTTTSNESNELLYNSTRILCWIMTKPDNHLTKAIHIRNTWGKHCQQLLFMSTEEDELLQSVKLNVTEGRQNLWNKTKEALKYIYDHHLDDAEWFLKADDDTFVIMENLRYLLYQYPPEIPIYFGAKFKPFVKQGYMSGGAGYALSREALEKFTLEAYSNATICPEIFKSEDVQLGMCLENLGVIAGDSRDAEGKERFIPLAVEHVIPSDTSLWYQNYTFYQQKQNESCCSASAISFHYVQPEQFYILDYLIYTLRPFGVMGNLDLPKKLNITDIIGS